MRQDFLFALRQLRRNFRFHILAAATLALGIGATTAIFSLVSGVLLRPLPFPESNRLVALSTLQFPPGLPLPASPTAGWPTDNSYPDFFDWRAQSKSLESIATYSYGTRRKFTPAAHGKPRLIAGVYVSADFFQVIGSAPQYGRSFSRNDEKEGVCSIIVSHAFWVSEFGASSQSIGGPIQLSDTPCTVIGVMPAGFAFPYNRNAPDFWAALGFVHYVANNWFVRRGDRNANVVARLNSGIRLPQAMAEINALQQRLALSFAEDRNYSAVRMVPLLDSIAGDSRKSLLLLMGAVTCVLLIACVNVAGLLLARGVARRNEFAVRIALGASSRQVMRQVLVESTFLSLFAGSGGVILAFLLLEAFLGVVPGDLPRLHEVRIDGTTLVFTILISLTTGICFGIFPAWSASRSDSSLTLGRTRAVSSGPAEQRLHGYLVVAETAVSLILLVGSGLLVRSFMETMRVNPGFDPHGMLTFRLGMSAVEYPRDKAPIFLRQARSALSTIPGVQSVTGAYPLLFTYDNISSFQMQGVPSDPTDPLSAKFAAVQPLYFETVKIPLVRGRTFNELDDGRAKRVAIVDSEFARQFLPSGDVIGKAIQPNIDGNERREWYEIVGVVGSVRTTDLTQRAEPQFFVPYEQANDGPQAIILRVAGDPHAYENAVRSTIGELNLEMPIFDMQTVDEHVSESTVYARFEAQLLTCFAVTALFLAAVGVYAALSEMVSRRRGEIGLRVALGAQRADVFQLIVRRGMLLAMIGMGIGLAGFGVAARIFYDMVYGVSPFDPWTIAAASAVLSCVSVLASVWPAWRAARLEPMQTLRDQ